MLVKRSWFEFIQLSNCAHKINVLLTGHSMITDQAYKGVVPGGAGGAMAPPDFGSSVNPISNRGTDYAHLITTGTPVFSELTTALVSKGYLKQRGCRLFHPPNKYILIYISLHSLYYFEAVPPCLYRVKHMHGYITWHNLKCCSLTMSRMQIFPC